MANNKNLGGEEGFGLPGCSPFSREARAETEAKTMDGSCYWLMAPGSTQLLHRDGTGPLCINEQLRKGPRARSQRRLMEAVPQLRVLLRRGLQFVQR